MDPITEPHPSSSNSNYAFITHSQETLPRNLPPSIDNANLARRRRRRTSSHDQAILEEEYRKCDRPDKTKRKEISSRVQMGEKEVQIWFQNKRQSARRKAKPLLPHEIIPNTTSSNNNSNSSSQQYSSQQQHSQGMMISSSSQYSSFDNSQQPLSREDIRQMSSSFNSDAHRRRRASVSSGIELGSPPRRLTDRGSFSSSDVSASQDSGRSRSQPIYLGLSDPDLDEDFDDDDDDIDEHEEGGEEGLCLKERTLGSPHHHHHHHHHLLPQRHYESSSYSKRQKLSERDNDLLGLEPSSPPTSSIPSQEAQHQQNLSLNSSRYDQEPEMTTSAHQRLQDVLSSMHDVISSTSTPAKPTFTNSRRTNPNPTTPHTAPPRLLKRTSSIRLSTSLEGKATVVLDEEPESPPSSQQTLPTPKKPSPVVSSGPPRKIVDSKIWEFYCDNQAMIRSPAGHASLQTAAEAKEALGLLRRKSSQSKLPPPLPQSSPVAQRKNAGKSAHFSSPTKAKKSRKIISAKSSRPKSVSASKSSSRTLVSGKKLGDSLLSELGQESDKENRPPGAPVSPPPEPRSRAGKGEAKKAPAEKPSRKRKRNITAADERRILTDHRTIPSQTSTSFHEVPNSSQAIDNFRSDGPAHDEYEMILSQRSLSNFFASSQESGPAVMDEIECVENLLSLRGGTWR